MDILLWKIRTQKNITLRQLEGLTGISRSTLNRIENEKVSPSMDMMEILSIALAVPIVDLFDSFYKYNI